jgi:hypothetical protein
MLVIGDPELRFRVNVRPTNDDVAQENYGLIHDLSDVSPARAGRDTGLAESIFEFCGMKFQTLEDLCRRHS